MAQTMSCGDPHGTPQLIGFWTPELAMRDRLEFVVPGQGGRPHVCRDEGDDHHRGLVSAW
jgi:hypothetical protein